MSHIPLLARQTIPKLQPPRRGPQVVCLCLLVGIALLLLPSISISHASFLGNATRAPVDPPPAAVRRIIAASTHHRLVTEETLQDLLATVAFLLKREIDPR